jgi:hypothetical protein
MKITINKQGKAVPITLPDALALTNQAQGHKIFQTVKFKNTSITDNDRIDLMRTVQHMAIRYGQQVWSIKDAFECPPGKEQEVIDTRIKKMIDDEKKSK